MFPPQITQIRAETIDYHLLSISIRVIIIMSDQFFLSKEKKNKKRYIKQALLHLYIYIYIVN